MTAVEWLIEHWKKLQGEGEKMSWKQIIDITELAKEMEKAQRIKDYNAGYDDAQLNHINDAANYVYESEYLNSK